ncbi:MAG TPA: mandelate racemase/muconate lactonizing enzyme family protein [Dehalococcoidia bacterium]|jgi:D-galactarolactone cycloisomerase|nr:mandelate racemase/muconate lactonizing enzyme family protein [Dehalococcoidia bacterium]HIK89883.1 mandelate racemase/muconate lactonizing enzyme family protein [Dehalococcoidia bacterium]
MKIDRIEVRFVEAKLDEPFGWSQRWTNTRSVVVLKVFTDDGVVGWGETYGSQDTVAGIASVARTVIGEDPANISQIWHKIHRATYQSHGFAGVAIMAASAIDTALHDIVGKTTGKPVAEVMGGRLHDSIHVYATGLYYVDSYALKPHLEEAVGYVEQSFTGMKMKVGALSLKEDADRVKATREAIGPDVRLMFDANESYDPSTALTFASMVADQDITWFEEPCASRDFVGNKLVQQKSPIPVSGGESLSTRWEFAPRLAERTFDIIQPDTCGVGGPSELHRVGLMAQAFGIKFNPHFWGTGISFAAAVHTLAVQPIGQIGQTNIPYQNESVLEFDQTPHPIRENLTEPFFTQKNSRVEVPTAPGLGIKIDESVLEKFTVGDTAVVDTPVSSQPFF